MLLRFKRLGCAKGGGILLTPLAPFLLTDITAIRYLRDTGSLPSREQDDLHDLAHLVKGEAWRAGKNLRGIAIAQIANEIGFHLAVRPESGIDFGSIKA